MMASFCLRQAPNNKDLYENNKAYCLLYIYTASFISHQLVNGTESIMVTEYTHTNTGV